MLPIGRELPELDPTQPANMVPFRPVLTSVHPTTVSFLQWVKSGEQGWVILGERLSPSVQPSSHLSRFPVTCIGKAGRPICGGHSPNFPNPQPSYHLFPLTDGLVKAPAGCDRIPHSILGGRRSTKKNLVGMPLAAVTAALSCACRSFRRSR